MKRPITILNLSDLHIWADNTEGIEALKVLPDNLREFINREKNSIQWEPDYIAIPGDIIDAKSDTDNRTASYKKATTILDSFLSSFQTLKDKKERIIAVPGNHDKIIPKKDRVDLEQNFTSFRSREINETVEKEFIDTHKDSFENFSDFYMNYCPEKNGFKYFYYDKFKENKLRYASGLKVFEKDKVCFLCVNTEWLYIGKKETAAYHLCTPIVKELTDVLGKPEYSDYTVVTLMHRKPDDLSWQTHNQTDIITNNALRLIEHHSDVLITGHDHPIQTNRPDMRKNCIQHFKLGSQGATSRKVQRFPYSVSEIIIDPIDLTVELLTGSYHSVEKTWEFQQDGVFPLRNKFSYSEGVKKKIEFDRFAPICLKAHKTDESDMEDTLKFYYGNRSDWKLMPRLLKDLDEQMEIPKDQTHLVLYAFFRDEDTFEQLKKVYYKLYSRDDIQKAKLLNHLIISMIVVDPPKN